jgi:hypothetical protein
MEIVSSRACMMKDEKIMPMVHDNNPPELKGSVLGIKPFVQNLLPYPSPNSTQSSDLILLSHASHVR